MGRRSARLVAIAFGLGAAALLASGCSAVDELLQLQDRIEREGYRVTNAFHEDFGRGRNEVQIDAEVNRGLEPPEGLEEIAGVVWTTYPRRFDTVAVDLGAASRTFSRGELQERFGERAPRLDERAFSDDLRSGIRGVAIVAAVVVGIGVLAIVATVVLVRRSRKRNPPPGPPSWPYGSPPPPPPAPPPGWSPPPPPSRPPGS